MRRRDRYLLALAIVVLALVALRLALPSLVKDYVNDSLQALEAYDGSVEDVDLHLWRGAYAVKRIRIVKTGTEHPTPFFSSDRVDFSVEWRNLMRGSLVAEGVFIGPDLNLVKSKNETESQLGKEVNWADRLEQFFPFRFNTVRVRNGRVTFRAPGIRAEDALTAEQINGAVMNLTNVAASGKETFADFRLSGRVLGDAPFDVGGSIDPLAPEPTFDVNLSVEKVQLPKVNPWLREYIKADAESGDFQIYIELAAADGRFEGYAKPLMQNVNIYSSEEPEDSLLKRLWEGVVDFAANILENESEDQVGARIPFSGTIEEPEAGIFATIVSVLRNAFVGAFARSLEGSVSIRDVKDNLAGFSAENEKGSQQKESKDKESEKD